MVAHKGLITVSSSMLQAAEHGQRWVFVQRQELSIIFKVGDSFQIAFRRAMVDTA